MNKKIILYFLITLIVIIAITNSSYAAAPLTASFNVSKTLAFWTPEKLKSVKSFTPKNIGFRNNKRSGVENVKIRADDPILSMPTFDNPNNPLNFPVGMLFLNDPVLGPLGCTASVFNTENGNIGMTAADCLFNDFGRQFEYIAFSPGYNLGTLGPLGLIAAEFVAAPADFHDNHFVADYGMMKFQFNDPEGLKLQERTGANGWRLNVNDDNILTTIFGYPRDGDMPDCPRNGDMCVIVKYAVPDGNDYIIPDVYLGKGVSGAPWTIEHNPNRNLGIMYGNLAFYNEQERRNKSPRYDPEDFNDLLEYVTEN